MAKEKQKGTVTDKGKEKLTTAGEEKENSSPVDERKAETMATEKQKGTVVDKGKKKITTAEEEKENSCPANFQSPDKKAALIFIMGAMHATYQLCVPIKKNYLDVVLQGGDQDSIPFSTKDATNITYTSFIEALRARLTNGVPEVSGIPTLPQRSLVRDSRHFVLVDLSNYDGNTVTVAIDMVNVYVVAFRVCNQAYFFRDAPEAAFTTLFTETVNRPPLNCRSNYVDLERRSGRSREETDLGITALDQAISGLWFNAGNARTLGSSFLVIIQMVPEAVRFSLIERRV